MRLVIEAEDFRRLSLDTQRELLRKFAGPEIVGGRDAPKRSPISERYPVDLTRELTVQLMHGLADNHRRRLRLFARKGGRVTMKQLLKTTGDTDARVLSHFQSVVTRKLRRITGDDQKRAFLIGWDFESTVWDRDHVRIVDGVYYVTEKTARQLANWFEKH